MTTYVVAASALEGTRYIRLLGFDPRTTRTVLWPGELAAASPRETRVVFLRGWSEGRSRTEVQRLAAAAARLRDAGALVLNDELSEDAAFRRATGPALSVA
ncbi:MAG TPA: hypothetical protein VIK95_07290 [Egibacteraceae bacterium]